MISDTSVERSAVARAFDVCVIGAGPAGITLARSLASAGAQVALMEGGGYEYTAESQKICEGESLGLDYFALDTTRLRFFGGSSNHWAGWCRKLDPVDFVARPHSPLSGWPVGKADLDPYATESDIILDLPPEGELRPSSMPDVREDFIRVQYRFSPPTRFRDKYWDEMVASQQIHVFLNANLVDLRLAEGLSSVTEAVFRGYAPDDPGFSLRAKVYALCTGGIENARLLLNFNSQVPEGIGNRYDLVGRYFLEHPHFTVADVVLRDPLPENRLFAPTEELIFEQGLQKFVLNLEPKSPQPPPGLLTASLDRLAEQVLGRPGNCAAPGLNAWWNGYDDTQGRLKLKHEQANNPNSRVYLSDTRDALGLRTTKLDWRLTELDVHTMRAGTIAFGQYLAKTDSGRLRVRDWLLPDPISYPSIVEDQVAGCHHMGTTRMADDPRHGVVDRDCRIHGLSNLFIGGSSVFPTPGYANPTYTIVQCALRLGDHLVARLMVRE
jgi:hypothetical protein